MYHFLSTGYLTCGPVQNKNTGLLFKKKTYLKLKTVTAEH